MKKRRGVRRNATLRCQRMASLLVEVPPMLWSNRVACASELLATAVSTLGFISFITYMYIFFSHSHTHTHTKDISPEE